jgi:hypothetical protein
MGRMRQYTEIVRELDHYDGGPRLAATA